MSPVAILHLDESCLGNGREGENPGGGGGLIESRTRGGRIERRDFYVHDPATTNNRMALAGATAALRLLARKGARMRRADGLRLGVPGEGDAGMGARLDVARLEAEGRADREPRALAGAGRRRAAPSGAVDLGARAQGHAKNEYANDLAVKAAKEQTSSDGIVTSGFGEWLEARRSKGQYLEYDPDVAFTELEARVASDEAFPLADAR